MPQRIFLFIVLAFPCNLHAQWYFQNPKPTGSDLNSVTFSSDSIGYIVGDNQTILKTTNGGKNWEIIYASGGINKFLKSVYFINDLCGYAAGCSGLLLKTLDGGTTWEEVFVTGSPSIFTSVFFINSSIGYITDDAGNIYKSTDGGISWESHKITDGSFNKIFFINENIGYGVGYRGTGMDQYEGLIYNTVDSGISWKLIYTALSPLNSVQFVSEQLGIAVGDHGHIVKTIDGGSNWDEQSVPDNINFTSISFTDSLIIHIAGYGPYWFEGGYQQKAVMYNSKNSGDDWAKIILPDNNPILSIWSADTSTMLGVGLNGTILRSDNAGNNWVTISSNIVQDNRWLYDIDFLDTLTGIIVGESGTVIKTLDGGKNWTLLETNYGGSIRSSCFINANTIIANTDYGIIKSNDGGYNWEQKFDTPTWYSHFIDSSIGFATEFSNYMTGKLFKTIDGGESWFTFEAFDERVTEIQFINDDIGYVLGMFCIYKTIDGGNTWSKKIIDTRELLYSFYFTSSTVGYAVGDSKYVYKTIDGGNTWSVTNIHSGNNYSISFFDDQIGMILGYSGRIYKTSDAGDSWILQDSYTNNTLSSVFILTDSMSFAVGSHSMILRTENQGGEGPVISTGISMINHQEQIPLLLYPNPFSSNLNIEFSLSKKSYVNLKIIDLKGIEMMTLFNEERTKGRHTIGVNNLHLKPGMYLISLDIDKKIYTRKILINGS